MDSHPPEDSSPCRSWRYALPWLFLLSLLAGCPPVLEPDPGTPSGNAGEPNDTFDQAIVVTLDANQTARIAGSIPLASDVDVYNLGEFLAGDRIIVDVNTGASRLDAMVALFDGGGRLIYENDDRNNDLNQLDPFVNHVVREDTMVLYVAIAASPLNPTTGTYDMTITVSRGGAVPPTRPQTIVLDVDGGSVVIAGDTYTVGPFDTGDISPRYQGLTQVVLDQIVATIEENFAGFNLSVLVTGRDPIPDGCAGSTVLLGGTSSTAYGLAQQIDPYNQDPCDDAIVYTEMFQPFRFGRTLTARELGTAIGNVASHEIGHLLGLNHVANVHDLMDTTGTASSFLLDQDFTTSPLDETIFPIGLQDGIMLLMFTLGVTP
ncbi:MAG TPA: matrixin family metalloprotease [Phycisphaerae bacterium]|nr:matrixin family metalloprotease [Phycisphaerae bacterium]HOJ76059.1 matrixin family metalloprotease [Phycisphaerae bacterium]HOM53100.1 matrixin family metalloprotease [Phycisphaerae bacterium]HON67479.1 matrixin family metalloprotease [Phycisphaerae bacterium]HPP25861.1 matrixin family metalloprotease [Phycisphaerae bacterium]